MGRAAQQSVHQPHSGHLLRRGQGGSHRCAQAHDQLGLIDIQPLGDTADGRLFPGRLSRGKGNGDAVDCGEALAKSLLYGSVIAASLADHDHPGGA